MNDIAITGLNIRRNPKTNASGTRIVAYFDCEVRGFVLAGCALAVTSKNGLTCWPPKLNGKDDPIRRVAISDRELCEAMTEAAEEAYLKMGGDPDGLDFPDSDLIPRPDPTDNWIEGLRDRG